MNKTLTLVLFALLAGACGSSPAGPDGIATIRTTTSFGFCAGYCKTTLVITSDQMLFVEEGLRTDVAPRRRTLSITAAEWEALVSAVDRRTLEPLPSVIGCPDCADGGAESLEVVGEDWQKGVTFEFNATIPELQPLLTRVRALRERARS
jgi:hypothetical protein